MNELQTSIPYRRFMFFLIISIFLVLFLDLNIIYKVLIVLFLLVFDLFVMNKVIINNKGIYIRYPFNPFNRDYILNWNSLLRIKVVYREGMTHGALMPSYIEFIENNKSKKVNYRPTKNELHKMEEMVRSMGVDFECKNNPYK